MRTHTFVALCVATCALALLLGPSPVSAGYIYPNDCPYACQTSQAYNLTGYNVCVQTCNSCLLSWYNCYSQFQPYFNGYVFYGYSCWCYIPWWGWFLMAIGVVMLIGCCAGAAFYMQK